jgi:hypothetical protein
MTQASTRSSDNLSAQDLDLRGLLTRRIAEVGYAPSALELALRLSVTPEEIEAGLLRLQSANALVLHPNSSRPWVVHPFALAPGSCWVRTQHLGYWANCLYCAFGIAAALRTDATVTTRYGGEESTVRYRVSSQSVEETSDVFHLSTPMRNWWDNVIFACSSFQPFRSDAEIFRWCAVHSLPLGAILSIDQLWQFAKDWYGGYLDHPWTKRSATEVREILSRHGFTGPFWSMEVQRDLDGGSRG